AADGWLCRPTAAPAGPTGEGSSAGKRGRAGPLRITSAGTINPAMTAKPRTKTIPTLASVCLSSLIICRTSADEGLTVYPLSSCGLDGNQPIHGAGGLNGGRGCETGGG